MPDWRSELDILLTQLDDREEPDWRVRDGHAVGPDDTMTRDVIDSGSDPDAGAPWDLGALTTEDAPPEGDEVSAVRREIESTIRRLALLARTGEVESALRDDVIFVLQALTRPHPPAWAWMDQGPADDEHMEWHLASAAAILRFCRIVQRLTNAITDELD